MYLNRRPISQILLETVSDGLPHILAFVGNGVRTKVDLICYMTHCDHPGNIMVVLITA